MKLIFLFVNLFFFPLQFRQSYLGYDSVIPAEVEELNKEAQLILIKSLWEEMGGKSSNKQYGLDYVRDLVDWKESLKEWEEKLIDWGDQDSRKEAKAFKEKTVNFYCNYCLGQAILNEDCKAFVEILSLINPEFLTENCPENNKQNTKVVKKDHVEEPSAAFAPEDSKQMQTDREEPSNITSEDKDTLYFIKRNKNTIITILGFLLFFLLTVFFSVIWLLKN